MYAVFFMSETLQLDDLDDQTIVTGFKTEDSAYRWIADRLVEANELRKCGDTYCYEGDEHAPFETAEEAVEDWQLGCAIEFFHVYKCINKDSLPCQ